MILYLLLSILIGATFSLVVKADSNSFLGNLKTQIAFGFLITILVSIGYGLNYAWEIYITSIIWILLVVATPTILILYFKEYFAWSVLAMFILGIAFLMYGNFHKFSIDESGIVFYSGSVHKILTLFRVEGSNVNMFILSDLYRWSEQPNILMQFRGTLTFAITGFIFAISSLSALVTYHFLPETLSSFKKNISSDDDLEFE